MRKIWQNASGAASRLAAGTVSIGASELETGTCTPLHTVLFVAIGVAFEVLLTMDAKRPLNLFSRTKTG